MKSGSTVNRESSSGWTDSASVASAAIPEIDLARQRSVRLIVSIPVLAILLVLGSAVAIYQYIESSRPETTLSSDAVRRVSDSLRENPEGKQLVDEYTALRETTQTLSLSLLLIAIPLSLIAAAIGFLLALQIVKPIRGLTNTMESISRGDFSTKLQPINLGEFGELGSTFNRMVQQLNTLFEERDKQIRGAFEGAHVLLDKSGLVLQADASAGRLFEKRDQELVGSNLLLDGIDKNDEPTLARMRTILRMLVEKAVQRQPESRAVTIEQQGEARRLLFSCSILEGQEDPRILLEIRDISGIANFYEQIQRADRLAAVGTLATGIAHEIRNPLASIRGMAQLLAETADADESGNAEYSKRIIREADRLEKLVRGIMDFAQSTDSKAELTNLNTILKEVVESVKHQYGSATSIRVKFDLDPGLPMAMVQPDRLRQALLNLVLNAFQYCVANKTGPITIQSIHLSVNAQRPIIIGISNPCDSLDDESLERLFEPFYTTKPDGTGLGLPIAYQTVSANGGILEVESEDNQIQFWIRLPRDPEHGRKVHGVLSEISKATPIPIRGKN